jgi:malate dehydrogenase (oxaloacetate-decarboxylating)(NADP+)
MPQALKGRMDPTAAVLRGIHARARAAQATVIFAEGDDARVLRAAVTYQRSGLGRAIVVGREAEVRETLAAEGMADAVDELTVANAANTPHLDAYKAFLYRGSSAAASTPTTSTASPRATATSSRPSCSRTGTGTAW